MRSSDAHAIATQDLLDEMGCELREYDWPDRWYIGSDRRMLAPGEKVLNLLSIRGTTARHSWLTPTSHRAPLQRSHQPLVMIPPAQMRTMLSPHQAWARS